MIPEILILIDAAVGDVDVDVVVVAVAALAMV